MLWLLFGRDRYDELHGGLKQKQVDLYVSKQDKDSEV